VWNVFPYAVETVITNLDIGSIPFVMLFYRQSATVAPFLGVLQLGFVFCLSFRYLIGIIRMNRQDFSCFL